MQRQFLRNLAHDASAASRRRLCTPAFTPDGPLASYQARVASGALQADALQVRALQRLERLHVELKSYTRKPLPPPPAASGSKEWRGPKFDKYGTPTGGGSMYTGVANTDSGSGGGGLWGAVTSLFGGGGGSGDDGGAAKSGGDFELSGLEAVPLGVYMHGGVGCGKSLLMDTFFDCAPVPAEAKRRVHFHEFMLEVHNRMHKVRMQEPERGDPLPLIAHEISSATSLLCFDEFQVTDVADALVMRRLFRHLFSHGLVMVSTSNREPSQLYLNGIQRVSFLPFIDDLSARCETHDLASGTDYRTTAALGMTKPGGTYMHPLGPTTDAQMDALFEQLTLRGGVAPMTLRLQGRDLEVPRAGRTEKVARFSFEQLCGKPLGAEDYLGLAQTFHTVFVDGVPRLTLGEINMVRRLITMVDAFYDRHVRLVISAEVPPPLLFAPDKDTDKADAAAAAGLNQHGDILGSSAYVPDSRDEVFAFDRTLSRLQEMRSHAYLVRAAEGGHGHKLAANHVPIVLFDATEALSEEEVSRLFHEYDVDASGALERPEVRLLLQDLTERRRGHRNVMEEEVEHAFSIMDADQSGEVTKAEFLEYFTGVTLSGATILQYGGKGAEQEEQGVAAARPATPGA